MGILLPVIAKHVIASVALLIFLFQWLLSPLREQEIEMAHLDPTEIVVIPYDLKRLIFFVGVTLVISMLTVQPTRKQVHQMAIATVMCHIAMILAGAPPMHLFFHTAMAALYMTTLTLLWTTHSSSHSISWISRFYPTTAQSSSHAIVMATCQMHATWFLTIPFQVLRLYDWGSQIQRWPLPVILGSTYGMLLGTVLGSIACFLPSLSRIILTLTHHDDHHQD